jgi:hypothetical protein
MTWVAVVIQSLAGAAGGAGAILLADLARHGIAEDRSQHDKP